MATKQKVRDDIRRELLRRENARRHLLPFCRFVDPNYKVAPHLELLADKLSAVEKYAESGGAEGIGRLIVNMPPRHGKSETASKRWPAFLLGRHPSWRFALVAYGDQLAQDFSLANRYLVEEGLDYHTLFPTTRLHPASGSVMRWTLDGSDLDDPSVVATGIGGPLTGRGFNVIVIDDPVKNRREAESPTYRGHIQSSYTGTLRNRLEPGGVIILICTRWHEDDLAGFLLENSELGGEQWTLLNLRALAEKDDLLGRKEGKALWPYRFGETSLKDIKTAIGSYEWEAQYQGHPKPPEGGKIKREWFNVIDQLPAKFRGDNPSETLKWYRYWDLAITTKETSSHTASARVAFDSEGNLYIADMFRDRIEWPEQKRTIKSTMLAEKELGVVHGIEKALHGTATVQEFMTDVDLRGVAFKGVDVHKDKLTRALPWIARAEARKVFLIAGVWVGAFLDEASNFTGHNDKDDDQVDTISGGVALSEQGKPTKGKIVDNPFYG